MNSPWKQEASTGIWPFLLSPQHWKPKEIHHHCVDVSDCWVWHGLWTATCCLCKTSVVFPWRNRFSKLFFCGCSLAASTPFLVSGPSRLCSNAEVRSSHAFPTADRGLHFSFYDKWQENGQRPLVPPAPSKDQDGCLGLESACVILLDRPRRGFPESEPLCKSRRIKWWIVEAQVILG